MSILPSTSEIEVVFDQAWPGGTDLGGRCAANRGLRFPSAWVVDISHGLRQSPAKAAAADSVSSAAGAQLLQQLKGAAVPAAAPDAITKLFQGALGATPKASAAAASNAAPEPTAAAASPVTAAAPEPASEPASAPVVDEDPEPLDYTPASETPAVEDTPSSPGDVEPELEATTSEENGPAEPVQPAEPVKKTSTATVYTAPAVHMTEDSIRNRDPDEYAKFWHELEAAQREKDRHQVTEQHEQRQLEHGHGGCAVGMDCGDACRARTRRPSRRAPRTCHARARPTRQARVRPARMHATCSSAAAATTSGPILLCCDACHGNGT